MFHSISITQAKRKFNKVVKKILTKNDIYFLKNRGIPLAVMVSADLMREIINSKNKKYA